MKFLLLTIPLLTMSISAATIEVTYQLVPESTSGETITIPNPNGDDFGVTPSAGITSGEMTVRFSADENGVIENGSATVMDLGFSGEINLRVTTGQQVLGQDVFVDLNGLLRGDQQTWSLGTLEGLSTYSESSTGSFDTVFGPVACSGNFFNAGCAAIALLTQIQFPLDAVNGDDVALSLSDGSFGNLDSAGNSTAVGSFEIPIQAFEGVEAPLPISFMFAETGRVLVVPEPGAMTLTCLSVLVPIFRRRR